MRDRKMIYYILACWCSLNANITLLQTVFGESCGVIESLEVQKTPEKLTGVIGDSCGVIELF
jgi:hypothetical protein